MKLPVLIAAPLFLLCAQVLAQAAAPPALESDTVTAFVAVNLLTMETERVLPGQTVLVEHGKIAAIGAALPIPAGARIVDGHGSAFLSPGLADMHTHSDTSGDLKVYLANGVTTVLNMGEASNGFIAQVRPEVNRGKIAGPHVYASFMVDGSPRYGHFVVSNAEQARAVVGLAKTNGYDFIKVYNNLSPESFTALADEGRKQHMPLVGHGVTAVGLERQLDAGQVMVAHAEEFMYTTFFHPGQDGKPAPADAAPDSAEIPAAIAFVKRNHAFVTADLNTYATIARQWGKPAVVERYLQMPEARYLAPDRRLQWRGEDYARRHGDLGARLAFLQLFTKQMADAGVALIAGTDAPTIPGLVPGYSLHDDLQELEQAGLSRYQALAAATRVPGEMIRQSLPNAEAFGTIKAGSRADLILSEKNPLDDLATLRTPLGVMANGNWYPQTALQALLEQVAGKYRSAFVP
ncbi:amidohydrolase family protein [Collimonas humicola]|uniref:amidohydrolase family protein n=1 Tax=Collimonas humicola TaxID=2825886 RepID=UPI001B8B4C02|nr:hypothetical protein [Collimonas humicola]